MSALTASAKPWVTRLSTYEAGRPIEEVAREMGLDPDEVIKLASNENPLGPSPKAMEAMRGLVNKIHLYPDGDAFYLRRELARTLGIGADHLFIGHGSNEIIALLGHIYLEPGTSIVMADRAFVIYRLVASLYEAATKAVPMREFTHDLDAMRAAVDASTRQIFVANPNNPTGTMVESRQLDRFIEQMPPHVVVVIDEAYVELLDPGQQPDMLKHIGAGRPVIVLRTFSKAHGLAGLRVGYAIAAPEAIALLHRVRQPFNVNAMGLAAALAALGDEGHLQATRQLVADGLRQLAAGFEKQGLRYVPSVANFILVEVGQGREMFEVLRRKGVIVRPMDSYGLPAYVRVTVGTAAENERFLNSLAEARREQRSI